jgi:putative inorganic carbon (hco3(-)) transporter
MNTNPKRTLQSPQALSAAAWPFLLLIATLPIVRPFNFRLSGLVVPVADLVFVIAFGVWVFRLITKTCVVVWSRFYLPLAFYLVVLLLSTVTSVNPHFSAIKLMGKIYLIGLAVLSFNLIRSTGFMRRTVTAWQVGTIVTVIFSLAGAVVFYLGLKNRSINLVLHGYGSLPRGNYPRIQGFFEYPAMLCNYLSVSLMLALMMWSAGWLPTRWVRPLCIGILITALFTFTPGLGGMALSLGIWLWLYFKEHNRSKQARITLAAAIMVAIAVFAASTITLFSYSSSGIASPLAHAEIKASHRAVAWETAFETFKRHPLLGRGVGMPVSSATYVNPSGRVETLTDAHNTYLSLAGELGLLGLLAFAAMIVFLVRGLWPLQLTGALDVVIKTHLFLALVDAVFFQSFVGSFEDTRHLWVLFGILAATKEGGKRQTESV